MNSTDGISQPALPHVEMRGWPIRQACAVSIVIALVIGAFLVARRLSGALESALPPWSLAVAAVVLMLWAIAVRAVVAKPWAVWLVGVVLLLFAIACSFPGERSIDWLIWLAVFGAFVASHNSATILSPRFATARKRRPPAMELNRVVQQITRSRTADGHDAIHGTLLAEFAPGERTAMLYVAFCPPFEKLPQVELESTADARLLQTLHNGAQIEVRLPAAAKTATSESVELYATDAE